MFKTAALDWIHVSTILRLPRPNQAW
jgi:hypothetical protein